MSKTEDLQAVHEKWKRECTCELKKTAIQAVPGDGNPNTDIVFVGEAPGKNEDLEGIPFVGAAGKFLNEMLEAIGMKRQDIYITNIVKYRPPDNRDPLPQEIDAYRPYLARQIAVIKPLVIATLGRFALNYFLPLGKIARDQGKLFSAKNLFIYPMFHPAAALRSTGTLNDLRQSFKKLPAVITKCRTLS